MSLGCVSTRSHVLATFFVSGFEKQVSTVVQHWGLSDHAASGTKQSLLLVRLFSGKQSAPCTSDSNAYICTGFISPCLPHPSGHSQRHCCRVRKRSSWETNLPMSWVVYECLCPQGLVWTSFRSPHRAFAWSLNVVRSPTSCAVPRGNVSFTCWQPLSACQAFLGTFGSLKAR